MPGEAERRSIFGLPVCVPQQAGDLYKSFGLRRAGILVGDQAAIERTVSLVAARRGSRRGCCACIKCRCCWRQATQTSTRPPVWRKPKLIIFHLRSETVSGILRMRSLLDIRYRGREITNNEIAFIRQLILDQPELSRWKLSRELCEAWQWKQANGALRDMVCRGLLLMLHRAGEIELPPVKRAMRNRIAERQKPEPVIPDNRPVRGHFRASLRLSLYRYGARRKRRCSTA